MRLARWQIIALVLLAAALGGAAAWYVLRGNMASSLVLLRHYPVMWLLAACLAVVVNLLLEASRSWVLTIYLERRVPMRRCFAIICQAALAGNITPAYAGTGITEVALLTRERISVGEGSMITVIKSIFSNLALVTLLGLLLAFYPASSQHDLVRNGIVVILVGYGLLFILLLVFARYHVALEKKTFWLWREIRKFLAAFTFFSSKGAMPFLWNYVLSVAQWSVMTLVVPILLVGLVEGDLHFIRVMFLPLAAAQLIALAVNIFAPTPGGAGAAELVMLYASSRVLPSTMLSGAVLLWRVVTYYFRFLLGGFFAAWEVFYRRHEAGKSRNQGGIT